MYIFLDQSYKKALFYRKIITNHFLKIFVSPFVIGCRCCDVSDDVEVLEKSSTDNHLTFGFHYP